MSPRKRPVVQLRAAVALAAISTTVGIDSALADSGSWTFNGIGDWSDSFGWFDGIIPDGAGNLAAFVGSGALSPLDTLTITLDTNRTIGSLNFADTDVNNSPAGWRILPQGGSVLTLEQTGTLLSQPGINVNALGSGTPIVGSLFQRIANINASLAGTTGFIKTGAGTLVISGSNAGLTGSINLFGGNLVFSGSNSVGGVSQINYLSGQLAFRDDTALNFSTKNINLINNSTLGVGNAITTGGVYGSGSNLVHTLGNVAFDQFGIWTFGVSGSNGYGLNMTTLTLKDGINLINQGDTGNLLGAGDNNNVTLTTGSGLVTVGTINYSGPGAGTVNLGGVGTFAGSITVTNGITDTGGGSASLVYSGSKTATVNGSSLGGDVYVTGGTTGTTAGNNFQAGVGTLILNTSALSSGKRLYVDGGTLVLGATTTHTVDGLRMGGATLVTGAGVIPAAVDSGSGTIAIGANGITVNTSTQFDPTLTVASIQQTAGRLAGRLDLGSSNRTVTVRGSSTLTVEAVVNGSGGIDKQGTGYLTLNNANTFTGAVNIGDGVVAGRVQTSGNAIGNTAANVSLGGALRVNGIATAGTTSVNNLIVKDSGAHTGVIVDASGGGVTTLSVAAFNQRESGTRGTFKVVPVTGSLNVNEIVLLQTGQPTATNNVLPFNIAVQASGSDTQLNFASLSGGNRVIAFGGATTNFASADSTKVFDLAASTGQALSGAKGLYGARLGAGASMSGSQVLTLGDGGASGMGGLILNGGAGMNVGTLQGAGGLGGDELLVWSGGTTRNSVSSFVNLVDDLTTGGSQEVDFSGSINFNGAAKNITVTGATAYLSGVSALSGNTSTAFTKRGGGILAITNSNAGYSGAVTVANGTLALGNGGAAGSVGSGAITNNSAVTFNVLDTTGSAAGSFGNNVSGSGSVYVNPGTATGIVTLGGTMTYTGDTTVQTGVLRVTGTNRLPTTTNLTVLGGSTLQLNGNTGQTVASLSGTGTITNGAAGQATLTVNGPGTFAGSIRNGTGAMAIIKNGSGTLVLAGANAFSSPITVNGGTVQANSGAAVGTGVFALNNAALAINTNGGMVNSGMVFSGNSTISVVANPAVRLFLMGTVAGSNFVLDGTGPSMFAGGAYTWTGGGTVNLVLNGRNLHLGPGGFTAASNPNFMQNFSGTLKFDDNNGVNSRVRFSSGNEAFTTGSSVATFDFGNGVNIMNTRNGTVQFNIGWIQGGTNSILEGCENGTGRHINYVFGAIAGNQTFHGQIRDYVTPEGNGIVGFSKNNINSTLTLKNTLGFTGGVTVNAGTLFLASGANVTNAASIIMNGGTLSILPGATITSNRLFATSLADVGGGINVGSFPGFSTPSGVNFIGGGTVYGALNHNAGSINPGAVGGFGTLTFSNAVQIQGGAMDFDATAGSANFLGAGVNDVLKVNASGGLDLTSGTLRINFFNGPNNPAGNTPPPALAVGQFYPIISYNGTFTGSPSNMFTTAKFRGSFNLEQGTGSLASTLGAKVIAIGGATNNLLWNPVSATNNYWDAAVGFQNWKPTPGSGSIFFFNGDSVTFDDTAPVTSGANNRIVQITPGLAPTRITVNTSGNYFFTGQGFGSIIGSTNLVKSGTGTLYIAGDNAYTGGTTINGGTLVVGDPNNPTTFPLALGGPTATTVFNNSTNYRAISALNNTFSGPGNTFTSGGNFVFNGNHRAIFPSGSIFAYPFNINLYGNGTVTFERPTAVSGSPTVTFYPPVFASFQGTIKISDSVVAGGDGTIFRTISTGSPQMTLDLGTGPSGGGLMLDASGQTFTVGALRGGPNTSLKLVAAAGQSQVGTFVVGHNTTSSTFDGVFEAVTAAQGAVVNTTSVVHVVKNGTGSTLTLTQSQGYTGNTIVNAGTLALVSPLSNIIGSRTITIGSGGALNISGLSSGAGVMDLFENQSLISNGSVVGGTVHAVSTSTIGGTTFGNPLEMDSNSTLSPGNSVGTLTVSDLTLNGQVEWLIELDSTGMDAVVLSGTQTDEISANFQHLNLSIIGAFTPGTFMLLDYAVSPANAGDPVAIVGDLQTIFNNLVTPESFAYNVAVVHDTTNTRVNIVFVDNSAQWRLDNDGSWTVTGGIPGPGVNWTSDGVNPMTLVPNSVVFGTMITAPRTVTTHSTVGNIANSVVFNSPFKYTVSGTGTLTLDAGLAVPVTVQQGSHAINVPVRALKTLAVSTAAGTSLSFGGTIAGSPGAGILKSGTGSVTFTRLSMPGGTMNVQGGTVIMTAKGSPNNVNGTNLFAAMTIAAGGKADMNNNAMILDFAAGLNAAGITAMLTELRAELADGRLFSSTTASNTTLGYRVNNTGTTPTGGTGTAGLGLAAVATFAGVGVDNTSTLIRVTYKGDSNLDGVVNVMDLYNLSLNWLSTNGVWAGGDFNYDGTVNSADLALLAQGWQLGNNNPLPADDLGSALTAAGIPLSAVPEPGTIALAGIGAAGLLGRRRRKA